VPVLMVCCLLFSTGLSCKFVFADELRLSFNVTCSLHMLAAALFDQCVLQKQGFEGAVQTCFCNIARAGEVTELGLCSCWRSSFATVFFVGCIMISSTCSSSFFVSFKLPIAKECANTRWRDCRQKTSSV